GSSLSGVCDAHDPVRASRYLQSSRGPRIMHRGIFSSARVISFAIPSFFLGRVVMAEDHAGNGFSPERYRAYLWVLAAQQLPARLRARLDPADVVQETQFKAHKQREQFRGQTEAEYLAWLRRILANNIAQAARQQYREPEILRGLDESSRWMEKFVAA